ncbi:hypothetical protein BDZ97DRAFT_1914700 [Flammula alnicola]|nr:hypothetical protein BDZ97DRAFT_1914700 [Flammula alnicola]
MGWLAGPGVPTRAMDSLTQHHPVLPEFEGPSVHDHERTTPQRPPRTKRPSRTDRSRPSRTSKPYDSKPSMTLDFQGWVPGINNNSDRPEPWPRIATMDPHEPSYPAQNLPTAYEEVTSHQSTASLGSERRRSWPDPYEDIGAERFSQFIQPPIQFGTREANLSTTSTLSRTLSHAQSSGAHTPSVPPQPLNASRPSSSHSSQHRHPSLPSNESTNTSYLTDPTGFEGPPTVLRFSSRSRNPQPELWGSSNQPTEATNPYNTIEPMGHFEGEISQAGPSQQQISTGRLRFQNPVTPQIHVANAARPKSRARATSVVHVKWDTERKRRQGYFAQEDGAEKSPFRHYNKTGCDFDS